MSQVNFLDVAGSNPEILTNIIADIGDAIPIANTIEILGGTDIQTTASGNTLIINFTGAMTVTWNTITSADNVKQILVNNAYISSGIAKCQLILPLTASVGDFFIVTGLSSLFQINQNANQHILFGIDTTTTGIGGSIASTSALDHVTIACVVANLTWKVLDSIGNLTVV